MIEPALGAPGGVWADLGAGDGTFTLALAALLGAPSTIYAVDRDAGAVESLRRRARNAGAKLIPIEADFTRDPQLPLGDNEYLDGMLLANSLHFVSDAEAVLSRLVKSLRPDGRVVLIEYDRRERSRLVPYPVPSVRLPTLAKAAGLSEPVLVATRPSLYSGTLYVARADRVA